MLIIVLVRFSSIMTQLALSRRCSFTDTAHRKRDVSSFLSSYDVPEISKHLDFMNIMSYDFHGTWDSAVGHNAPLYPLETASRDEKKMSVVSSQASAAMRWMRDHSVSFCGRFPKILHCNFQ